MAVMFFFALRLCILRWLHFNLVLVSLTMGSWMVSELKWPKGNTCCDKLNVPEVVLLSSSCKHICPRLNQCQGLKGSRLQSCSRQDICDLVLSKRWWMLTFRRGSEFRLQRRRLRTNRSYFHQTFSSRRLVRWQVLEASLLCRQTDRYRWRFKIFNVSSRHCCLLGNVRVFHLFWVLDLK